MTPTWRERVAAASECGAFTFDDRIDAASWTTCAVHEQHVMYPEAIPYVLNRPTDDELYRLGDNDEGFCAAVRAGNIGRAECLLDAIEDRVLQLNRAVRA